jgi:hypothetical protein
MPSPIWLVLKQILAATIRIEKKLDEVMSDLTVRDSKTPGNIRPRVPINYGGQACPLCQKSIAYKPVRITIPDDPEGKKEMVLMRFCGCVPRTQELFIDEGDLT